MRKILIADEYMTMRRIVRSLLISIGFQPEDIDDCGLDASNMLRDNDYELLIIGLPITPADLDVLHALKSDPLIKMPKVLLVTGENRPEYLAKAKAAGVESWIIKPFNSDGLRNKVVPLIGEPSKGRVEP